MFYGRGAVALLFVTGCRDPQDDDLANSSHAFFMSKSELGGRERQINLFMLISTSEKNGDGDNQTLLFTNGFKFVGQIIPKKNPTEGLSLINVPICGIIYHNDNEIYSGDIIGEIEEYFEEYQMNGQIKERHNKN